MIRCHCAGRMVRLHAQMCGMHTHAMREQERHARDERAPSLYAPAGGLGVVTWTRLCALQLRVRLWVVCVSLRVEFPRFRVRPALLILHVDTTKL